jgi:amino acid transporter
MKKPGQKGKNLDLTDLVAISAGQVIGAGVVTIIGPAIGVTGPSAWLAYATAVLIGFVSILPFIFLSSTVILKGGEYSIVLGMLGERPAGAYALAFITQCLNLSLLGTSLGWYLHSLFPLLNAQLTGIISVTLFFILNLFGVTVMAKVQKVLTTILIAALLSFSIIGMFHVNGAVFDLSAAGFFEHGFSGFAAAVSLYAYSTYGQYMVINFSKDAENPKKNIPLAVLISTGIIFIIYVSMAIVNCGVLPVTEVADKPLTVVAKQIFPGMAFALFIICGPLMALSTTLNSTYGSRANPILRAAQDGWFPASVSRCNSKKVPVVIMAFIYVVGILPLLFNLSIKTITSNLVLVGYLLRMITALAIVKLPVLYREQWKKSFLHIPDFLFYVLMAFTFIAQIYLVFLSLKQLPLLVSGINIVFLFACIIYALVRYRRGAVHIVSSVSFE